MQNQALWKKAAATEDYVLKSAAYNLWTASAAAIDFNCELCSQVKWQLKLALL